jgi:predicted NBD/HSP70 family sugar kinase
VSFERRNTEEPSPLPLLRLSAPVLSSRLDGPVTLSTLARLVASGTAVSKADLCHAAGLARTTVSTGVDELLDRGVLRVAGTRPTPGRGRPADRLALSPRGGHVLVADLGAHGAHLAVVDLSQRIRAHQHVDIDVADGPDAVLTTVESQLGVLRARVRGDDPVRAAVIGVPGPVDGQRGTPVRPPIMAGWHAYPVSARLRRTFGCPVLLENDVNLRALGEARALPADQAPLLFVKVGTGIGGGLITGAGELHHGADGAAGDIGHVRVRGGPDVRCVCGNVGCIEALASASAIARRLREESGTEVGVADVRALVAGRSCRASPGARGRRADRRGGRDARALLQPGAGHAWLLGRGGERRAARGDPQRRLPAGATAGHAEPRAGQQRARGVRGRRGCGGAGHRAGAVGSGHRGADERRTTAPLTGFGRSCAARRRRSGSRTSTDHTRRLFL